MNTHPLQSYWTEAAKQAMHEKAKFSILPGSAPIGYKNVTIDGEVVIVPNPATCAKVKNLFLLARMRKLSLRGMLPMVAEMGLVSRNGKPIGASSLHAILTNPFYMGMVRFNRELIQGQHEPLVDRKLFEMVQRKLEIK